MFILLMRFLMQVSFQEVFFLFFCYFFFFFISACLIVSVSNIPKYLLCSFSPVVLMLSWFGSYIPFGYYYHHYYYCCCCCCCYTPCKFFIPALTDGISLKSEYYHYYYYYFSPFRVFHTNDFTLTSKFP